MAKLEIDLVDTNTDVENHQTEDTKPGIFHDATKIAKEVATNTNKHCEISDKQEDLNVNETEQGIRIKSEDVQNLTEKEENQIEFAIHETIEAKLENEEIISYICGNHLNLEENFSALNEGSQKYTNTISKVLDSDSPGKFYCHRYRH